MLSFKGKQIAGKNFRGWENFIFRGKQLSRILSIFTPFSLFYPRFCHIRGKFKSKNKHQNTVNKQSFILVGMRDWESSLKNCDLLEVFSNNSLSVLLPESRLYLK